MTSISIILVRIIILTNQNPCFSLPKFPPRLYFYRCQAIETRQTTTTTTICPRSQKIITAAARSKDDECNLSEEDWKKFVRRRLWNGSICFMYYMCIKCNKTYYGRNHMKLHLQKHSDNSNFQCKFCFKSLSGQRQLTNHLRSHNIGEKLSCPTCHLKFQAKSSLDRHIRQKHANLPSSAVDNTSVNNRDNECTDHIPGPSTSSGRKRTSRTDIDTEHGNGNSKKKSRKYYYY